MSEGRASEIGGRRARAGAALGWVALALILGGALGRAAVSADPFPHWDTDPMLSPSVKTGWGPTARMALDTLALVGCASGVLGAWLGGSRVRGRMVGLLLLGGVGVVAHGYLAPADPLAGGRGELDDLLVGGAWMAALGGAVGLAHVRGRARRLGLALTLGFVVMLAGKGAAQRYVEHPMTVRDFDAQRERVLAARGWRPDSPQAMAYERRLRQNDASGWFGLSNVYATFGAIGAVAGLGLGLGAARRRDRLGAWVMALMSASGLLMLWMSHSKGGLGAAVLGALVTLLIGSGRVRGRWRGWLLAAIPAGVLALVVVRGLIGERVGELSLLFRWHYMQGGARMILEHPLLGVGPAGFKEAYLLTRPALGVEEVTSPHNVLIEWVAALGVFGIAWTGLGLLMVIRSAGGVVPVGEGDEGGGAREDTLLLALGGGAITAASALTESAMATPEGAVFRALGLIGWVGGAAVIARQLRGGRGDGWVRGALAGVAGVIAAHTMIEVTAVWANSAALLGGALGLCVGDEGDDLGDDPGGGGWVGAVVGAGAPLLLALSLGLGLARVARWEGALDGAAAEVRAAAVLRDRLGRIEGGVGLEGDRVELIGGEIAASLGEPPAPTRAGTLDQLRRLSAAQGERAMERLDEAIGERPDHTPTARAAARLALGIGELEGAARAGAWRARASRIMAGLTRRRPSSASAWAARGSIQHGIWTRTNNQDDLLLAKMAWGRAFEMDPLSLQLSVRLMDASDRLGQREEAAGWAGIALELDGLKRLDPLKRLSERERARCERIGRVGAAGGP